MFVFTWCEGKRFFFLFVFFLIGRLSGAPGRTRKLESLKVTNAPSMTPPHNVKGNEKGNLEATRAAAEHQVFPSDGDFSHTSDLSRITMTLWTKD